MQTWLGTQLKNSRLVRIITSERHEHSKATRPIVDVCLQYWASLASEVPYAEGTAEGTSVDDAGDTIEEFEVGAN
jgi:hypothetical protein